MISLRQVALGLVGLSGAMFGVAAVQSVEAARKPGNKASSSTAAIATPEILLTPANRVPACVTPARLDALLVERNPGLDTRFRAIAAHYKSHGEQLGVRWDYAFYQMILETNSLKFTGDVKPRQNNFAGLGATGGGVPGESFADVSSGVRAQLQHLVAYAGVKVEQPVAKRTRDNQDDIIARSKKLGRAVRFADLTNRWAADSRYARSIDTLAGLFKGSACQGRESEPVAATPAPPQPPQKAAPVAARPGRALAQKALAESQVEKSPPSSLGVPAQPAANAANCGVMAASFGGTVTLLIRAEAAGSVTFTALDVDGNAEAAMAESYIKVHAPGGKITGRFKSRDEAVGHAYTLCDSGRP